MEQTPELRAAIEELYSVFQSYRLGGDTGPCPCCHSPEDDRRLRSKLLRNLGTKDLWQYTSDALYTWGGQNEFKHFLPRILELLVLGDGSDSAFVDPESVLQKLSYFSGDKTSWRDWPQLEQTSISNYLHATWKAVLDSDPDDLTDNPYEWLCGFAHAEGDLSLYLDYWLTARSIGAHRNLARMILWDGVPNGARPTGGYWPDCREQWDDLVDWLRQPEVRKKLEVALKKWSDMPFANELFDAAVLLP